MSMPKIFRLILGLSLAIFFLLGVETAYAQKETTTYYKNKDGSDDTSRPMEWKSVDKDGKQVQRQTWEYHDNGKVKRETWETTRGAGGTSFNKETEYDDKGRKTKVAEAYTTSEGKVITRFEIEIDYRTRTATGAPTKRFRTWGLVEKVAAMGEDWREWVKTEKSLQDLLEELRRPLTEYLKTLEEERRAEREHGRVQETPSVEAEALVRLQRSEGQVPTGGVSPLPSGSLTPSARVDVSGIRKKTADVVAKYPPQPTATTAVVIQQHVSPESATPTVGARPREATIGGGGSPQVEPPMAVKPPTVTPGPGGPTMPGGGPWTGVPTPGSPLGALAAPTEGAASPWVQIQIAFQEKAPEQAIRELVLALQGTIVEGPTPLGVYTVELPVPRQAAADLEPILEDLRGYSEVVRLVERRD